MAQRDQVASGEAVGVVLAAIAEGGKRGMKIAAILPQLILDGRKVGELVSYDGVRVGKLTDEHGCVVGRWAEPVAGTGIRGEWIERLAGAICSEAIDRFSAKEVVEILLRPRS